MAANAAPTEEEQKKEKQFYMFLVAFGGHKFTMNKLKKYLRYNSGTGISHFFYLEYFLQEPLPIDKNFVSDGGAVFCPFLERMIKEQPFLLDWKKIEDDLGAGIEKLKAVTSELLPRRRDLEKKFLDEPLVIETKANKLKFGKKLFDNWNKKSGKIEDIEDIDDPYTLVKLEDDLQVISELDINKLGIKEETKRGLIKELAVLIYPWAKSGALNSKDHVDIVGVPIASNKLFYGYILVGFFHKETEDISAIREHLKKETEDQATKFYLPALILCHHSLYEKFYLSQEGQFAIEEDMPFCLKELSASNNMLERNIHKLWEMRGQKAAHLNNNNNNEDFRKSHFIFKDRFWGSPISIQKIEEALTWDMNFVNDRESKQKLKTFLIFGGPGSGKDTLSKMIGLFSLGHTFSEPYIFNMAALKPDWVAPSSLAGMHLQLRDPDKQLKLPEQYVLDGIFKKVLDKAGEKPDEDKWPVLIFDELNSLDIDTQGTLLRILENAEIVPIGGIRTVVKTENAERLLVVGVVNELPHQLTMEDTVKSFSQDKKLWGSLLGTALYESFRGVRRLRDDLYYRFKRGGYIELPDLDNRREDIPIIFFASLPDELRNAIVGMKPKEKIFVEYDVWDLLTDVTIQWKGNIRQLQAVAHNIAREVMKKEIKGRENSDIDVPLVRSVLEKMKLMKKHESKDDPATDY